MKNLSKPKRIAALAVIIAVLVVPVYLAFNDQGVQDAISSLGSNSGSGELEKYISGSARYDNVGSAAGSAGSGSEAGLAGAGEGGSGDESGSGDGNYNGNGAFAGTGTGASDGDDAFASLNPNSKLAQANAQDGGADVIDAFRILPTPKPVPTPTPKWIPENIATDGELLIDGLVEEDSVNVLIIGVDRTAYLADTIGVVSISESKQTVKLIMFSRDLYIGYSEDVVKNLEKLRHNKLPGVYKLNNTYNIAKNTEKYAEDIVYNENRFENHAYDFLAQVIYEKFDIRVDDFVQINTYGLVKLVDTFGGVRVYVPITMRYKDPDQNLNINISKGSQVLNGSQAEGFVRFRQGYDSRGKLTITADRTENQIAFLKAFYEQHAKLSNISKIPDVISTLHKNIVHSISADDIFIKYIDILTAVVNDSYSFESVDFELGDKRINGSVYYYIKNIATKSE